MPAANVEIVNVDVTLAPPPLRAEPAPRSVAPSKNSTVPVGVFALVASVTVAVNVTDWPGRDGLLLEATPTLVREPTVWLSAPLPPRKLPVGV